MNKTLSNFSSLSARLRDLTVRMGMTYSNAEWNELIHQSTNRNNLQGDELVPSWLVDFVHNLTEGKEVECVCFRDYNDETNIELRCIGFVEGVIGGKWEFDGESQSVVLDSIGMLGAIDHEGSCYHVMRS